ncbi:trans-acting regulatory protein HvrA [Thioclava dalianensis]|uniref:Trans-acting regulatory protein HvrA n=1 Tax=Thioclava dalianensis TaxID=1185766 RepID=A0A074TMW9_9RHOB|nr:H-NS histone family protein [Thioclava dalianensis]KEP70318.1 trans-acting regulatory protein HvrA [Thioclava dalianensis]SFN33525.1 DNA-binding protein H-NS [Thioclava dalianensis]
MNLETMSLDELKALQKNVEKAIASYEARKKKEALDQLEKAARDMGYSLSELTSAGGVKPRRAVAPKYANPANPSETWSGRGRKPRWVQAALDQGKSLDDLKI